MSAHSVLLVEDNPDDAFFVKRSFEKAFDDVDLHVVGDGEAAIAWLQQSPLPDLVLLDLKLPRMTGFEVLAWLRGRDTLKRLPVVVLTSSRERRDVDEAYDLGANSYLVKPVSPDSARTLGSTLGLYWLKLNEPPFPR